ncbi:hypothetical protein BGY98DRAFT_1093694 [Russula aff. rugulosa BPL654]|nr:hypothetical protein BGY98DRAFT_1093694 [Russula aff. rugulosa BPL654]
MPFSRKKKHSEAPSTLVHASGLASSQVPSNLQSQSQSQSHLKSPQKKQRSEPVCPWSAHALPSGQSPSPYLQYAHSLSTSATTVSDLFLFGGYIPSSKSPSNDLYAISIRDFSTTLLQTSGDVPSPRFGHRAVLTGTSLLIWGGNTNFGNQNAPNQSYDDSFYLLNLVSREWTRIVVHGPGPGGRCYHTMNLIGSKLFVFGGSSKRYHNDIWALDLNHLRSNPFWEPYEPVPGNERPLPRSRHVSVTTGDRIIVHGGHANKDDFNDTWSFNISTRKWTELQCTGSIPSPRGFHAAVLIDDVMYVYGGRTFGGTCLGDLTALNLSTQRWTSFQDIGPSPSTRFGHAMACDGTRVFVLGGRLSAGAQVDDAKPIHVLDTKLLIYPKHNSNTVKHSEETTELAQKLSAGHPTQGQPQQPAFSSHPRRIGPRRLFADYSRSNPDPNGLPSLLPGMNDIPGRVLEEEDDSEGSTEHDAKLVAPDASEKEAARSEDERIADLERQLSETLAERAQLTDQLAEKRALLEQGRRMWRKQRNAEANAAQVMKRAGSEQRELQAKFDELLLSRDQALEQAQSASQKELTEVHAKLKASESELAAVRLRPTDAEVGWEKSKAEADTLLAGTQAGAGLVNMDADRVMRRLMERVRSVEAEMASLRGNEKSIGEMECRNEG